MFWTLSSAFGDEVSSRISADEAIKGEFTRRLLELAMRAAGADKYLHDKIVTISGELGDEVSARV